MEHPFTWIGALFPGYPEHVLTALFVAGLLLMFAAAVHRKLAATEAAIEPEDGVTRRNVAEVLVEAVSGVAEGVIGHGSERFVPLLASIFVFIMCCNLLGLVPGFSPPTSTFETTFGLGLVAFVAYNVYGIREHGFGYVKQFLGPVMYLAPLLLTIELFSHAFRPVSLGIRLFANIFADHMVVEIFTGLMYVSVPFYFFGLLVALVQSFVFMMLTAIYIAMAVSHEH